MGFSAFPNQAQEPRRARGRQKAKGAAVRKASGAESGKGGLIGHRKGGTRPENLGLGFNVHLLQA